MLGCYIQYMFLFTFFVGLFLREFFAYGPNEYK